MKDDVESKMIESNESIATKSLDSKNIDKSAAM
eukprot:CAMPEP_0203642566 /NCGR_PEP_ID=MMETSP0088-20131115/7946_1 /ASSEMBLY_ACC=CAM_ASM_001087 /TAXON_ID=426623 /ORGANISM="Chaetoceros affinis, Strain CCMP159" /LENGTH=32 /DNA_ID= /DNA_START= /DNA_END= /DNA_ORIENTATION=